MKLAAVVLLLAVAVVYQVSCTPIVNYIEGNDLKRLKPNAVPSTAQATVSSFKWRLDLGDKAVPPTSFCTTGGSELDLFEPATDIRNTGDRIVYIQHDHKTYPMLICSQTTYKQLLERVAKRFKLKADEIAFSGVSNEGEKVKSIILPIPIPRSVKFEASLHGHIRYVVTKRQPSVKKPAKLDQLTGITVTVVIPEIGPVDIENVDLEQTVDHFRRLIEAKFGASADYHKSLAICAGDNEAKGTDKLNLVFKKRKFIPTSTIPVVDWITGKAKTYKFSYCPNSTFQQVLKRALPSYSVATGQDRVPAVFSCTKSQEKPEQDGLFAGTSFQLTHKVVPIDPEAKDDEPSKYYILLEDSSLIRLKETWVVLQNGLESSFQEIRERFAEEVGHNRAWAYPFCAEGVEIKPGQVLDSLRNEPEFLVCAKTDPPDRKPRVRSVLVMSGSTAAESKEFVFQYCHDSRFEDVAVRILGLLERTATIHFSYLAGHTFVDLESDALVLDHEGKFIVATIDGKSPPSFKSVQHWMSKYIATADAFNAVLQGIVGLPATDIDPRMTIGQFRRELIEKMKGQVDEEQLRRFPFCVPKAIPTFGEMEMDDNRSFAYYGLPSKLCPVQFDYQYAWVADWTGGDSDEKVGEKKKVGVCKGSRYDQIAKRVMTDPSMYSSHTTRIVVEDKKPREDAGGRTPQRRSIAVSGGSSINHDLVCIGRDEDGKDKSVIFLMPAQFSIIRVKNKLIPIKDPQTTPIGLIRELFKKEMGANAYTLAFCANTEWMFWEAKEMDEKRSFAYYHFVPERWTVMPNPKKVRLEYSVDGTEAVSLDMEYCPRSTVEDLKFRLLQASQADPSSKVNIYPATMDYPTFSLWSLSGDANFLPSILYGQIASPESDNKQFVALGPTDQQRSAPLLRSEVGSAPVRLSKTEEQLLIEQIPDPKEDAHDVITFTFACVAKAA